MLKRKLGSSSLHSSILGLGALHFGVFLDEKESTLLLNNALDQGITFIDTAPLYGNGQSEAIVGSALKGRRDEVILSTKAGLIPTKRADGSFAVKLDSLTEKSLRSHVESSLRALRTDRIDLFQLHAFNPSTPLDETLGALDALKQEGKILAYGCSNFSPSQLNAINRIADACKYNRMVSYQAHFNMIERRVDVEARPLCVQENTGIICNRALARGLLTGKYIRGQAAPPESRAATSQRVSRWLTESTYSLVESLSEIATCYGKTLVELAIAWLLSRLGVCTALVGVRNNAQLTECVNGASWVLEKDEVQQIDESIRSLKLWDYIHSLPKEYLET
ncbi:MAG: aldo/keto reductase [Candidatus Hinthialibacter antarcticus]|nr:aldo/keto reductase [Candidatus Hinthialibacter antarcticus]